MENLTITPAKHGFTYVVTGLETIIPEKYSFDDVLAKLGLTMMDGVVQGPGRAPSVESIYEDVMTVLEDMDEDEELYQLSKEADEMLNELGESMVRTRKFVKDMSTRYSQMVEPIVAKTEAREAELKNLLSQKEKFVWFINHESDPIDRAELHRDKNLREAICQIMENEGCDGYEQMDNESIIKELKECGWIIHKMKLN